MNKSTRFIVFIFLVVVLAISSCTKDYTYQYLTHPFVPKVPAAIEEKIGGFLNPSDNSTSTEGIALGRKLFYDTRLSGDNSVACASCHQQQFAFADDTRFSEGINNILTSRNSPTIFNQAWNKRFFWDGRRSSLETQAHDPITSSTEMRGDWSTIIERLQNDNLYPVLFYQAFGRGIIDSMAILKAIAQFERSMISFDSKFDHFYQSHDSTLFNPSELRGYDIFLRKGTCNSCHTLPLTVLNDFANIGLEKGIIDSGLAKITGLSSDIGKFKNPSLRNLAYSAPYMHNGKFKTIREVINFYNNDIIANSPNIDPHLRPLFMNKGSLSPQDVSDLENFLKTLNDPTLIGDQRFARP